MAKRIEQSRKHGHHDPRYTDRVRLVSVNTLPPDDVEGSTESAPALKLVGGTEATPVPVDAPTVLRA
jgi:hypothetical protein